MQDPNPLPWGAQDRFQAHFIVRTNEKGDNQDIVAETKLSTAGHFGSKKLVGVTWIGSSLADELNKDTELANMISKLPVRDAKIWVDPTKKGIRIYGKWKNSDEFGISKELFEVYDRIASHIKKSI